MSCAPPFVGVLIEITPFGSNLFFTLAGCSPIFLQTSARQNKGSSLVPQTLMFSKPAFSKILISFHTFNLFNELMAQESDCRIALVKGFRVLRSNFLSTQWQSLIS